MRLILFIVFLTIAAGCFGAVLVMGHDDNDKEIYTAGWIEGYCYAEDPSNYTIGEGYCQEQMRWSVQELE